MDRSVRDGRVELEGRLEVRKEKDEMGELFAGEGGGVYTVIYVAAV